MTNIFIIIFCTVVWVLGIKIVTSEGMLLEKLGEYGEKKVEEGKRIFEPLLVCQWCMPSIHSLFGYLFPLSAGIVAFNWRVFVMYPIVVVCSSYCCGMLWLLYNYLSTLKKETENKEQLTHFDISDRKKKHFFQNQNDKKWQREPRQNQHQAK